MSIYAKIIGRLLLILIVAIAFASNAQAQRPRFPDFFQVQPSIPIQTPGVVSGPVFPNVTSPALQAVPPPATIIAPSFDPFQTNIQPLPFGTPAASTIPSLGNPSPSSIQVLPPQQQILAPPPGALQQPFYQQPAQPFYQRPAQPFPRAQMSEFYESFRDDFLPRLLERPRARYTYLPGNNGNELQIHDIEIATTLTFPRFLFLDQPVRITPGFIGHFWAGPDTFGPFGTGFDLPAQAFSAFLNLEYVSNTSAQAGFETSFTAGYFADYDNQNSDSIRYMGTLLGWARVSPTNVFKFGAEYLDRVQVKLLPAFGLFIRPTPDLQVDLYFPRPRIAQRLPDIRCREIWGYVGGEYGGGSWTVERHFGAMTFDDRIDINDVRAFVGIEAIGQRGVNSFVEFGYVFNRELISQVEFPTRKLELQDTVMLRMGIAF